MFAIDWLDLVELIIYSLIGIGGFIPAIYYLRKIVAQSRYKLKTDLEILNMLDEEDPKYNVVRNRVEKNIDHIYKTNSKFRIYSYRDLIGGSVLFVFSSIVLYYIILQDFILIYRIPLIIFFGILLLGGLGGILQGFKMNNN